MEYRKNWVYYGGFLIIFGLVSNFFCLIIYRKTKLLQRCRLTPYLYSLALSDLIFFVCLCMSWLKDVGVQWHDLPGVCSTMVFVSQTCAFLSAWFVAMSTAEIAQTYRPRKAGKRKSVLSRRAVASRLTLITLVGLLINSWTLAVSASVPITNPPTDDHASASNTTQVPQSQLRFECRIMVDPEVFYRIYTVYDTFITLCVPVFLIFSLITYVLIRSFQNAIRRRSRFRRRRNALVTRVRSKKDSSFVEMNEVVPYHREDSIANHSIDDSMNLVHSIFRWKLVVRPKLVAHRFASYLIMTKSVLYLLFNLPIYFYRIWMLIGRVATDEDDGVKRSAPKLFHLAICIYYAQFALNFCIFCAQWSIHWCRQRWEGEKKN